MTIKEQVNKLYDYAKKLRYNLSPILQTTYDLFDPNTEVIGFTANKRITITKIAKLSYGNYIAYNRLKKLFNIKEL